MNRKKGGFQSDGTDEMPLHLRGQSHMQSKTSAHITTIMPGQRWVSDMETELGLGTVVRADKRRVTISFQDGACVRQYARENAPLRRVTFKPGDRIRTSNQESGIVQSVTEENGIITYITDNGDFAEPILSDAIRITAPFERLLAGQTDPNEQYALRTALLHLRNRIDQSPARGFTGPRIELIPHQLYIANEIASRYVRRVLLADEVGLGKTIEACLILHRLIVSGRTSRALIVVPESLVHIWFVELIRKFNLVFKIYDTDYFGAVYTKNEQNNPFLDEQLIITNATFLVKNKDALRCAVETTWDTLIVDEVHHIRKGSPEFDTIESLTEHSRDVLFLTATPYQGGEEHHFARLQLLDSSRYSDFQLYQNETETHRRLAAITGRLVDGNDMSESDIEFLKSRFPESADRISSHLDTLASDPPGTRQQLVAELLDRHGIGRAMFRNTRMAMGGFPSREVRFVPCNASEAITDKVCTLFVYDSKEKKPGPITITDDPRIHYIANLLRNEKTEKVLLICRSVHMVKAIARALEKKISVPTALFHEELTLLQRDRNAAYFAEEDGARILLCSEIGSEGRNFQFVHHLILFDLPVDPELIEQRIGRLDRIGQKGPIIVHVPFVKDTPYEVLARWFHEGIGIFSTPVPAAQEVFEKMGDTILSLARAATPNQSDWRVQLDACIVDSRILCAEIAERIQAGRDRLLEQHSFRPEEGREIVELIKTTDNESFQDCMEKLFHNRGIVVEPLHPKTWKLWSEEMQDTTFPGLQGQNPVITFSRQTALHREDLLFITQDHPAVRDGIDLFLGSENGNATLALWPSESENGLLLETLFVVECLAPPHLHVDRFLPATPVRIIVDHTMHDTTRTYSSGWEQELKETATLPILEKPEIKQDVLPGMFSKASEIAKVKTAAIVKKAIANAHQKAGGELDRLQELKKINPHISDKEIERAHNELVKLEDVITNASPRIDAVRVIWKGNVNF